MNRSSVAAAALVLSVCLSPPVFAQATGTLVFDSKPFTSEPRPTVNRPPGCGVGPAFWVVEVATTLARLGCETCVRRAVVAVVARRAAVVALLEPLEEATAPRARLWVPNDAAGKTIHVILAVRDRGTPPLVGYRRAVVTCRP